MPKKNKYPRLRVHVRKGANGQVRSYYYYDMRPEGEPDIKLGTDYAEAIRRWDELHNHRPQKAGKVIEAMEKWEEEELPKYDSKETRDGYRRQLNRIKPIFGPATWDSVELTHLVDYLDKRTAKTQANREMAVFSIVWNYARKKGLTKLPFPAAGMQRSRWKNKEKARQFEVTDALFDAVYAEADEVLRAAMDISTATGLRVQDTIAVPLGADDDVIRHVSRKTGKRIEFDVSQSQALQRVKEWRAGIKAHHLRLVSTPDGKMVTYRMLYDRYKQAREAAAEKLKDEGKRELAREVKAMFLRDMRKRAANLAESAEEASKLLQHSSQRLTEAHYRTRAERLKPVR
jgi:hypothetical protein